MGNVAKDARSRSREVPEQPGPQPPPPRTSGADASLPRGVAVAEVLQAASLAGSEVLAGADGLDRLVRRLNVMEVPDILPWIKPDELLLTTGYPLRREPERLAALVGELDEHGLAALAVKPGRYLDRLPAAMLDEADRRGLPVVALPQAVAFDEVINEVLADVLHRQAAVLARSEEAHRALVRIVLEGGGLPEVARELVGLLGGAVVMTTPDGRVLADAGARCDLDAVYASGCFEPSGRFRTEHETMGLHGHGGMRGRHIVVPVVAGGVDHARILAHASADGSLAPDDVHVLERAATVAALAVTKQLAVRAVESKYQGDFLRDLLGGRVETERAVDHGATLGWDLRRPVVVVVAELDAAESTAESAALPLRPAQERFATAWQTVVRPRDPHAAVAGFSQEVVAVLGVPMDGDVERLVRELVAQVCGDGGGGRRSFSTGVSRVCDAAGLPAAYEHARKAVHVGRRMQGRGAVAHFDQLGVFRLLSLVDDVGELNAFMAETLGSLGADDAEAADLRHTLEVLLESNLNVAETARALHFHYNTLRYRIGKLERMVGPFTHDPHLRLNLMLALQIRRMRGR